MFRRRKSWQPVGDFPTASVQRLPFQRHIEENKILYTTRFEPHNADKCGIFEYDLESKENKPLKLWTECEYYPRWDVTIYNETDDTILFVGGANVKNHHHRYELLVIYNLRDDTIKKLPFNTIIGGNARCCLSHNDEYLHILGGTSNNFHILYDITKNKINYMYSFYDEYPQIQSCGVLYSPLTNIMYMFGGRSSAQREAYDSFYSLDFNNPLSLYSMEDCTWLLINGYIEELWDYDYPVEINDEILNFLGILTFLVYLISFHCIQNIYKYIYN